MALLPRPRVHASSPMKPAPPRISLDTGHPIWPRFFTVAPLVVVGTREGGGFNFAPKHMAMPLGFENYFGFVCTPRHATYHNAKRHGAFTVTFPRPDEVMLASLAAAPRCDHAGAKPALGDLATFEAEVVDGRFLELGYLFLECELDRVVDGFGSNSLVAGRVVAAHVAEDAFRTSGLDDRELLRTTPLLAFLAPDRYARVETTLPFPFPAGFTR